MAGFSEKLGEHLFDILKDASDDDLAQLEAMLAEFKDQFPLSYLGLMRQPFAAAILGSIEEAIEYHDGPTWEDQQPGDVPVVD